MPFIGCGHFGAAMRFLDEHHASPPAAQHWPGFFDIDMSRVFSRQMPW
jgi:hypothetical protein